MADQADELIRIKDKIANFVKMEVSVEVISKYLMNCKRFFSAFLLIIISLQGFAQEDPDSLKTEKNEDVLRVKLNTEDSLSKFVPVDKLISNDIPVSYSQPKKIPGRAGLFSAILPGLGQAYNGSYFKIPIIYSLFAGMYFLFEENNTRFKLFREAYRIFDDEGRVPGINYTYITSKEELRTYKDYYKRNRDLNIIIATGIYLLNILDASVDAHLMDYDISEDLSLKINPEINYIYNHQKNINNPGFGLKFVISMK